MIATPFPNQPSPYGGRNLFAEDLALRESLGTHGAADWYEELIAFGAMLGASDVLALGDEANRHPPELATHDARGERSDEVTFHPAWHALMQIARKAGEHCLPWTTSTPGAQVARAAAIYLHAQVENGTQCPITMTFAAMPVLRRHAASIPDFAQVWEPRLLARTHDPRTAPIGQKQAALIGMGMTERQGGSDVRSNRTQAQECADGTVRITGHKWFFSVPQSDAHLVLAQETRGISCFFLPRFAPDGTRNAIRINRLKDKLGNRSNASSEVEFDEAVAWRLGTAGEGISTILEMVRYTRLDCVLGSAGIMRAAVARALHHARQRVVFGKPLFEQPLMRCVLADMALEVEAAAWLALRLARAFDAPHDSADGALARLVTPAAKYWVCKRGPSLAAEAMEVLGGNGYIEASVLPRLYRELPVNSIWEGSGNVMCLDVLRTMQREPQAIDALRGELASVRGMHASFDGALAQFERGCAARLEPRDARRIAQNVAVLLQAALLLRHAPPFVAHAFCASRLAVDIYAGAAFGSLPDNAALEPILARAAGS